MDEKTFARVTSMSELREALRTRRQHLGLNQRALDERAGLQDGYTGKLEVGVRNYGDLSLECTLGALGVGLHVVVLTHPKHGEISVIEESYVVTQKKFGAQGGAKAAANMTPKERAERAAAAAKARWEKRARSTNEKTGRGHKKRRPPEKSR
jgi:hypothetical protein